jgi:hypothetical protein
MKIILLTALAMSISITSQASILKFNTIKKCQTYIKQEPLNVDVQEARDGQAQLVITHTLIKNEAPLKIQVKKVLPPPMNAGMPLKYVGQNDKTKESVTLSIGLAPLKVGKLTGKGATLYRDRQDDVQLLCMPVK